MRRWRALVREPSAEVGDGERTFVARRPVDVERFRAQHAAYVRALTGAGVAVRVLSPLPGHPDAVFVEDPAVILDEACVVCRSGAPSRRGEAAALAPHLPPDRPRLDLPAGVTLDGGDVLVRGRTVLVGRSTRSGAGAGAALARLLEPLGYRVEPVPVEGALHLKTAVTAADATTMVVDPRAVSVPRLRAILGGDVDLVDVEGEAAGANVLGVDGPDGRTVLVSASAPRTARRLEERGLVVVALELSEVEKAEAGVTCLGLLHRDRDAGGAAPSAVAGR